MPGWVRDVSDIPHTCWLGAACGGTRHTPG